MRRKNHLGHAFRLLILAAKQTRREIAMRFFILIFLLAAVIASAGNRQMTVDDLWAMRRLSGIQVDSRTGIVLFRMTEYDMEKNSGKSWIMAYHPSLLAPDTLFGPQDAIREYVWKDGDIWVLTANGRGSDIRSYNVKSKSFTTIFSSPYPLSNLRAQGQLVTFVAHADPRARDLDEAAALEEQRLNAAASGQLFDALLYRHWDSWRDGKYNHLFALDLRNGKARQIVGGKNDSPPIGLGSGHDIVIASDGNNLAYVRNPDSLLAVSTNNDIYLYSNVSKEIKKISTSAGNDNAPKFSSGGRYLAFLSMARAGFEADRRHIMVYDVRNDRLDRPDYVLDRSADAFTWSDDDNYIYFTANNEGYNSIYELELLTGEAKLLLRDVYASDLTYVPGLNKLYFLNQSFSLPAELFAYDLNTGAVEQLTYFNQQRLAEIVFGQVAEFTFVGADSDSVHGWLLYPPNFDEKKKYGLLHIIHGGPQGAIGNSFHYRWNMQLFATFGYVVAAINFHGSTGYGQAFTDRISGDWGGAPYTDIMLGTDYLLANHPYLDGERLVAAGASYGGFMINWIATQTNRFKALVSHDGVFDQVSMYGATEELWFPEWEMGGTPYAVPENYRRWSPSTYAANMQTPMLVIHGEHDYRVPVTQGMQLFTALQRLGVPSRFLYYPDETHFVLQPQNAQLWWQEVYGWLDRFATSKAIRADGENE
jgi:dipeptidyl aminopeptidase/acylaminoacyl peptidase